MRVGGGVLAGLLQNSVLPPRDWNGAQPVSNEMPLSRRTARIARLFCLTKGRLPESDAARVN